jgi:IstB-like ATP binding protein
VWFSGHRENSIVPSNNFAWAVWPPCWRPACARRKANRSPLSTCSPVWSPTNSLVAASACWSGGKKQAQLRDAQKSLDNFDFNFNKKMNRSLVFDLATGTFIASHEDGLFLGPPGTGKSYLAQAIGQAAIQQGYPVLYRETHTLLDELADATLDGTRKEHMEFLVTVPLLIIRVRGRNQTDSAVRRVADCGRHSPSPGCSSARPGNRWVL